MKKYLILFMLIAAVGELKAQQLQLKPADSLSTQLFNIKPVNPAPLIQPQLSFNDALNRVYAQNKESSIDHMPIAYLGGYSKMPVVKLEGNDNMPVKKLDNGIFQAPPSNSMPGWPVFKNPGH